MRQSDTDPPEARMLIVRHERHGAGLPGLERFWLGGLDALAGEDTGSIEVRIASERVTVAAPVFAEDCSELLARRLVGAVFRDLVGRGEVRIEIEAGPHRALLADELGRLGYSPDAAGQTWEAGGAG